MSESFVQITEGSGKKLHSVTTVIGADTVHDEVIKLGEPYLATYTARASFISTATVDSHLVQLMAGAGLKVYVRRIRISQHGPATAASTLVMGLHRLTTAGTGGGGSDGGPYDISDPAVGATAQKLPTVKGVEGVLLLVPVMGMSAVQPASTQQSWVWEAAPRSKGIVIPAGAANGLAIKNVVAVAGAFVAIDLEFSEANF